VAVLDIGPYLEAVVLMPWLWMCWGEWQDVDGEGGEVGEGAI
jgi:hypothetical protein